MRPSSRPRNSLLSALIFIPTLTTAITLDCERVFAEGVIFNLKPLSGPHSVSAISGLYNTTYTIDICQPIRSEKGTPKDQKCTSGTRVCGLRRMLGEENVVEPMDIAGDYPLTGGPLDPKIERLKTSASHQDSQLEGVRIEMNGNKNKFDERKQSAIVEFVCPREGATERRRRRKEEDDDEKDDDKENSGKAGEEVDYGKGGKLKFVSFGPRSEDSPDNVLRLTWITKYACEKTASEPSEKTSTHWGFFTWIFVIIFLSLAAYLIFGSWLNYNRYGARGWDLLPHGDTIRDVPYILQDWGRKVVSTVQGGGTRGGYSAV